MILISSSKFISKTTRAFTNSARNNNACRHFQWIYAPVVHKHVHKPISDQSKLTSDQLKHSTTQVDNVLQEYSFCGTRRSLSTSASGKSHNDKSIQTATQGQNDDDDDDTNNLTMKRGDDRHFHEEVYVVDDQILRKTPKRVWKSKPFQKALETSSTLSATERNEQTKESDNHNHHIWRTAVDEGDLTSMKDVVNRISVQEKEGGRMRQSKLGVLREDPKEDMRLLIENYTVPAIASALRDREDTLQHCASLIAEDKIDELRDVLRPYESRYVDERRQVEINLDLTNGFCMSNLEILRKGLNRMPRRVSQAHRHRAGVVLPLCNINGVPCILFEKRSPHLRAHPDEVCLPGGMVSSANDKSIVATCLREMAEEIEGIDEKKITVLGVLRCNWGEVHHLVGVAVTPVVCFIGDISSVEICPSPDEVAECFTVPLDLFLDDEHWVHKQDFAPMFTGGPYPIWGLTGYILHRFVKDVLARYRIQTPSYHQSSFCQPKFRP